MPRLKGPVPQVQAKEGPMPQLVKKRRSGWAVLAVGALVASILVVGASPAAAAPRQPDDEAPWKACLGPAMADQGFTDVSMSTHASHYGNINCLAYYDITVGRSAGVFDPGGNVTRSQMALFLARAADVADIDLGEAEIDVEFTDLNADDTERFDAINRLVGAGIMFGDTETSFDPPSETVFAPTDYVTRWEMAMFLFAFLDRALTSVLIDELPNSVEGNLDGTGHVELRSRDGETGVAPDDYFRDARRQTPEHVNDRISAVYELGVTIGQNDTVGEEGVYNPNGLVTRAQMATFIMRAMGHTNLRPAGLTAQSTNDDTQVSMRDADFGPIGDVRTEVFTTNFPDDAFDANGECIGQYVEVQDPSFDDCMIDRGDRLTDGETGNALWEGVGLARKNRLIITCNAPGSEHDEYQFMAATRGSDTDYTIYAWSSSIGDEADADDVFESVEANVLTELTEAVKFIVTGEGSGYEEVTADDPDNIHVGVSHPGLHIKMGQTVTFTVQLLDEDGNPVGPTPGVNNYFEVVEDTYLEAPDAPPDSGTLIFARSNLSLGMTGLVYDGDTPPLSRSIDPRELHARDDVVDKIAAFPTVGDLDYTRIRSIMEPDSSGQFTVPVSYSDPVRLRNNRDALVRVTIIPRPGNPLEAREMTMPMDEAILTIGNGVQVPDVRFSDNAPVATTVEASAEHYRIRSLRNRNSIAVSVLDQYGALYRGGEYVVEASDTDHDDIEDGTEDNDPPTPADPLEGNDFPDQFRVSTSGRRSLGYTHTGTDPERQDVTLELKLAELRIPVRIPREIPERDDSRTPYVNEAAIGRTDDPNTADVDERDDPSTPYINEGSIADGNDDETTAFDESVFGELVAAVPATDDDPAEPAMLADDSTTTAVNEALIGVEDDPDTETVNEAVFGIADDPDTETVDEGSYGIVATEVFILEADDPVSVYWAIVAAGAAMGQNMIGDPILLGDPSANYIVVDEEGDLLNSEATPVAYPYGADDNFVVEGASVTLDQFEEILAQYDPFDLHGGLIALLGDLTWSGYDYTRPRDGATWSIDRLSCREPASGD